MKAPAHMTSTASYSLVLAAGILALVVTALLLRVVWRLSQTRQALAEVRAGCDCCTEASP